MSDLTPRKLPESLHIFGIKNIESYHLAVYMLWIAPVSAMVLPLGSYLQRSDHPVVSYLFPDTLRYVLMVALFFLALIVLDIAPSNTVIVAILFSVVMAIAISQLAYSEKEKASLKITLAEFGVLLVLGLILTHVYWMTGMAVATVASVLAKAGAAVVTVKRNFTLRPLVFI